MSETQSVTIDLARLWGDFREFRGEMRSEMSGFKQQLTSGLDEVREAASNHTDTSKRVELIERENLGPRMARLEANLRVIAWVGAAVALMTLGLFSDMVWHFFTGVG
jgi:hypothetical protein